MSDALKAREALARLRENLASFDAEVAYELATGGERADLWGEIDVNVEDLRAALSALDQPSGVRVGEALDAARKALEKIRAYSDRPHADRYVIREIAEKTLSALDLSAIGAEGWKPTHRHKKRGTDYMLLGIGKMQAENWHEHDGMAEQNPSIDMREVAVYRGADGQLWVRPREEFEDGRFELLPSPPEPRS